MVGIAGFVSGAIIGAVGYAMFAGANRNDNVLTQKLADIEQGFQDYKNKVNDHFKQTAQLTHRMTETYRDIYDHLTTTANDLCDDETTCIAIQDGLLSSAVLERHSDIRRIKQDSDSKPLEQVMPPKDYAPKKPEEKGMFSDDFGIEREAVDKIKEV